MKKIIIILLCFCALCMVTGVIVGDYSNCNCSNGKGNNTQSNDDWTNNY